MPMNVDDINAQVDALLQGSVSELLKPLKTPGFKGTDFRGLEEEITRVKGTRESTQRVIEEEQKRSASALEEQKQGIAAEAQAKADAARAKQEQAQELATLESQWNMLFGISADPSSDVAEAAKSLREHRITANEELAKIKAMQGVGFMDNPLDWLYNQIQLPSKVQAYNRQADLINGLQAAVDAGIATKKAGAEQASKAIPTITAAQAKAASDLALAEATQNKAKADTEFAKQNVEFAARKFGEDLAVASMEKDWTQLRFEQEKAKYQAQIDAIRIAENHAVRMMKAAELLEKIRDTAAIDVMLRKYEQATGYPKGTFTRAMWQHMTKQQQENAVAIASGGFGATTFEAMVNAGATRLGPEISQETYNLWNYLQTRASEITRSQAVQGLDEKQKPFEINKQLVKKVQEDVQRASEPGNPFNELPVKTMIASKMLPSETHLAQVLQPFVTTPGQVPYEVILEAIRKDYKNPAEAGMVAAGYYRANIELRNRSSNASSFKLSLPTEYKVKFPTGPGSLFQGGILDLTKVEDATKWMILSTIKEQAKNTMWQQPFGRPGG